MRTGPFPRRRSLALAAVGILAMALTACTGRGGGQLAPDGAVFTGPAMFGFAFSCEDASTTLNSPAGQLRIQLAYSDRSSNKIISPFSVHGTVDTIDPVVESMICIGQEPPPEPDPQTLVFLGRYRLSSSAPTGFPSTCPARQTAMTPLCRFEVVVRDNDMNRAPSIGDYFQIKLSSGTDLKSQLDPLTVFYTRAGLLSSGNLTVDY